MAWLWRLPWVGVFGPTCGKRPPLFADTAMSPGDRFDALNVRALGGDQYAEHFALQPANECQAVSRVPANQPPIGHKRATACQAKLRGLIQAEYVNVLNSPAFDKFQKVSKRHATDVLDQSLQETIREQFADKGAGAALQASDGAIMARPDETTLEILRRLQQHRVQLGEQHLTGIGKTSPQQPGMLVALDQKPQPDATVESFLPIARQANQGFARLTAGLGRICIVLTRRVSRCCLRLKLVLPGCVRPA